MENLKLTGTVRSDSGKGVARKLRGAGKLPAILYGQSEDPISLTLGEAELRQILRTHTDSPIVKLSIAGREDEVDAVVREVQRHPATGRLLHADLQRINLDEKIRVDIRVELEGDPAGVKEQGGILEHGTRSVNVLCMPSAIPSAIVIDVTELRIHDSTKVKDVTARYPDVEFLDDPETTLAAVSPPVVEKEVVEVEAGVEGEAAPAAEEEAPAEGESKEEAE